MLNFLMGISMVLVLPALFFKLVADFEDTKYPSLNRLCNALIIFFFVMFVVTGEVYGWPLG